MNTFGATEAEPSGSATEAEPDTSTAPTVTSTTTDGPAVCGDGKIDPGEECDDGMMNGDDQACTADCLPNICGDGKQGPGEGCDDGKNTETCVACKPVKCGDGFVQEGVEECDDGNPVNTDDCVACKLPKCGDGFVQAGVEECEDGNMIDDDSCSNTCELGSLRVFVSSQSYMGNLGGLEGADSKCSALAQDAGLGGTWMAWLSDGATGPAMRFTTKGGQRPYVLIDGKVIATTWADLIDGTLAFPINITEKNTQVNSGVWTNTKKYGTPANADNVHCQSWNSPSDDDWGVYGNNMFVDSGWTSDSITFCTNSFGIYCVEQ